MNFDVLKMPERILMTADAVGGVWTYALDLARAFESFGIKVSLAAMGVPPNREQEREARRIPNLEIFRSEYKLEWMENAWEEVRAAGEWLLKLEQNIKPDLIHLNGYVHGALPFAAPKLVVGHSCVLSWWRAVKNENAPENWNEYKEKVERGLRAADLVIAPTEAMLNALEENYGFLPNKKAIANGRETNSFHSDEKEDFVLAAGRVWDEAKNISALARVAPRLPFPVYVAGDEKHPDGIDAVARFENVDFLGRLSTKRLAEWMSRAAVFALPARYEPFGLTPLEAALSGCSLVLGDIASLREVWQDAALYVPPDDEDALEKTLKNLMQDKITRTNFARSARIRASEFSLERMAKDYLNAYSELLAGSSFAKKEAFACMS